MNEEIKEPYITLEQEFKWKGKENISFLILQVPYLYKILSTTNNFKILSLVFINDYKHNIRFLTKMCFYCVKNRHRLNIMAEYETIINKRQKSQNVYGRNEKMYQFHFIFRKLFRMIEFRSRFQFVLMI